MSSISKQFSRSESDSPPTPEFSTPDRAPDAYALLDDCNACATDPRSRLYTGLLDHIVCETADELAAVLKRTQGGDHAVGVFSYELGAALQLRAKRDGVAKADPAVPVVVPSSHVPPAQILVFRDCAHLSSVQVTDWLTQRAGPETEAIAGIARLRPSVTERRFTEAIGRIRTYIEAGDVYQVNYSLRLHCDAYGSPEALYRRLRARQPVPYGALIGMPDGSAVLSLSPELFLQHHDGVLTARPMKGTAPASTDPARDAVTAAALRDDPKNRAENLMIVDLMRNDLGRLARPGSVHVPHLFEVERYRSVLQMTSTVRAELGPCKDLFDIFAAVYPCGSITGAPKRRAMEIIDELEPDARGVYTGAIGWFEAPLQATRPGNFCLAVPIRTLTLGAPGEHGIRAGVLGVGAGIVHDSTALQEHAECLLKAAFMTGLAPQFVLFETMQASRMQGCRHQERHLARLGASAAYFGFRFDDAAARRTLGQRCRELPDGVAHRLRLALSYDGSQTVEAGPLLPISGPVTVQVSTVPALPDKLFLAHKTSVRAQYDAAWREAERAGAFDMLFLNAAGELTEGARSNVFLRKNGAWRTPMLAAGVLPGIMRALLLSDPGWSAREARLTLDDLREADEVVVCNSLRGALAATVDWQGH